MAPLTPPEERAQVEEYISGWKKSEDALPLAIQITSTTTNSNMRFIALRTINFQILNLYHQLGEEEYQQIFNIMVNLLGNPANDDKTIISACTIIATIFNLFPPSLSAISQFNANQLAIIFNAFLEIKEQNNIKADEQLAACQETILQVLTTCDITPNFFNLLTNYFNMYCADTPSVLFPLLQKIQQSVDIPECYSAITRFYENLLKPDPLNLDEQDIEFVCMVIQVMITICDRLLGQESISDVEFSLASAIWSELIDSDIFDESFNHDFSTFVFAKFNELLQIMVQDPDEFFVLIDYGANKYKYLINNSAHDYWNEIFTFLNTLIAIIDSDNIDKEEILKEDFASCFDTLTNTDCENGVMALREFFLNRLESVTDGVYYALVSSSKQIILQVAPTYASILPKLDFTPSCILKFISKCGFCTQDMFEYYIQCAYTQFQEEPTLENAIIIKKMIYDFTQQFIQNRDAVIDPILSWLPDIQPLATGPLINGLLCLSMQLGFDEKQLTEFFSGLLQCVSSSAVAIIGEGTPGELEELTRYANNIMFPSPMEPLPGDRTYFAPPKIVSEFCASVFGAIADSVSGLWLTPNDEVQSSLCYLLWMTLKSNWIQDVTMITSWISEVLSVNPIPAHVKLLSIVWKHPTAQTEQTIGFLNSLNEFQQLPELMRTVIVFLKALSTQWPGFFEHIQPLTLLAPLSSPLEYVVGEALDLVLTVVQKAPAQEFAHQLLAIVRDGVLGNFSQSLRPKAINVLFAIANDQLGTNFVSDAFISAILFRDENTEIIENVLNSVNGEMMSSKDKTEMTHAIHTMSEAVGRIIAKISGF